MTTDAAQTAEQPAEAPKPKRALVVMAHPDDAEFLCAGTVAKLCADSAAQPKPA